MNFLEKFTYNMYYWSVLNINIIKKKIWQPVDFLGIPPPPYFQSRQTYYTDFDFSEEVTFTVS